MEILSQVTNAQFLFTVAAVAVVLVCAALVFVFGFHSAEQPQFDKLPLVVDDKKSALKKNKKKDKKSSPNRTVSDEGKTKTEASKKSPAKEKKEEKVKETEKPKAKERPVEPKVAKKDVAVEKKGKKKVTDTDKPADFDDGLWEEVPKKSEKKKVKSPEEKEKEKEKKKESPVKKNKKVKEADVEAARPAEEPVVQKIKVLSAEGPKVDEEAVRALQAQVEELQRVLKEAERRDQAALGIEDEAALEVEELTDVKDLRSNKRKDNKEKQSKKKAGEQTAVKNTPKVEPADKDNSDSDKPEDKTNAPAFDELGDTWTDAKVAKKGKKKARKDQ